MFTRIRQKTKFANPEKTTKLKWFYAGCVASGDNIVQLLIEPSVIKNLEIDHQ